MLTWYDSDNSAKLAEHETADQSQLFVSGTKDFFNLYFQTPSTVGKTY